MRILFQGDSITDGNRGRTEDPNHLYGHGYVFSVVSLLSAQYPDMEFFNRGNSGDTAADLLKRWKVDAVDLCPDVVSLLIGTNDAQRKNFTPERFEWIYRTLLEDLPDTKFILCEPFRFQGNCTDEEWAEKKLRLQGYQKKIRQIALDTDSVFVPLQDVFEEACKRAEIKHWIWDGIHPTAAGHALLTQRFLECTADLFSR